MSNTLHYAKNTNRGRLQEMCRSEFCRLEICRPLLPIGEMPIGTPPICPSPYSYGKCADSYGSYADPNFEALCWLGSIWSTTFQVCKCQPLTYEWMKWGPNFKAFNNIVLMSPKSLRFFPKSSLPAAPSLINDQPHWFFKFISFSNLSAKVNFSTKEYYIVLNKRTPPI